MNSKTYSVDIGDGLFTLVAFKPNEEIIHYVGDYMLKEQVDAIRNEIEHNYVILIEQPKETHPQHLSLYLNCYGAMLQGNCLASKANDPRGLVEKGDLVHKRVYANARIMVDARTKQAWLKATRPIQPGEESLVGYGEEWFSQ